MKYLHLGRERSRPSSFLDGAKREAAAKASVDDSPDPTPALPSSLDSAEWRKFQETGKRA
ncbi:MAG: hypothetical protein KA124_03530 [Luteimonas sp.]|nr:hypothetical protein [Luteimonas sp.]